MKILPVRSRIWVHLSRNPSPSKIPARRERGRGNELEMAPSTSAPEMSQACLPRRSQAPQGLHDHGQCVLAGGLAITEGGKAQLGLLFPCSNFSGVGKLLKGRDGVSS